MLKDKKLVFLKSRATLEVRREILRLTKRWQRRTRDVVDTHRLKVSIGKRGEVGRPFI